MPELDFPVVEPVEDVQALWNLPLLPVGCPVCGQAHLVTSRWAGTWCPNCGQGKLEPQPALLRREAPEKILPFVVPREQLQALFRTFTEGVWLRPPDFDPAVLAGRAVHVFWPLWLVDADITGPWQAEVGYDYQVKSSQESYASGAWRTRELVETRVRWEPRLGLLDRHYENVSVPAHDDHEQLTRLIGEYDDSQAVDYAPGVLGDAALRVPELQPESVWPLAETNLTRAAASDCQAAAGGQHIRNFNLDAGYHRLVWTQLLRPMYVSYYADDEGHPHLVYVNGRSGLVGGDRMASQRKGWLWAAAALAAALLLLILGLIGIGLGAAVPPAAVLGGLAIVLAIFCGVLALVPVVWPWQWNRRQRQSRALRSDEKKR